MSESPWPALLPEPGPQLREVPPLALGDMKRVGLVHDYLLVLRGAERAFSALASLWPDAPIHTLLYDSAKMAARFGDRDVRPSPLQRLGARQTDFRRLLPLLPSVANRMPTTEYDLVVSSSSAFGHYAPIHDDAVHVSYCYTPFRYAWFEREAGLAHAPSWMRPLAGFTLDRIRSADARASRRVTRYVAISKLSQERIHQYWDRDADVVYPPTELHRFAPGEPEDFFLVVCELVPHKRIEIALEAARRADKPIKVCGDGPELERLKALYEGRTATFVGRISDAELADLYARCAALVVPNVEEFGLTAVEAQASGRPVLAADRGGAKETVIEGETGTLVPFGDVDALAEAMRETDFHTFSADRAVMNSRRFSPEAFQSGIQNQVRLAMNGSG